MTAMVESSSLYMIEVEEGELTCAICLDLYTDPTVLKCKHSFCKECVSILTKPNNILNCPLCREETKFEEITPNTQLLTRVSSIKKLEPTTPEKDKEKAKKVVIPRNIKLLEEYDAAIGKGAHTFIPQTHCGYLGYGLDEEKENNHELRYWRAMIIGPQESPIGQVIYNLTISVPDNYPKDPPEVRFINPTVVMDCVNDRGFVDIVKIEKVDMSEVDESTGQVMEATGEFFKWEEACNIADVLIAIRENMYLERVSNDSADLSSTSYVNSDGEDETNENDNDNDDDGET